jgi:hypothetical protein
VAGFSGISRTVAGDRAGLNLVDCRVEDENAAADGFPAGYVAVDRSMVRGLQESCFNQLLQVGDIGHHLLVGNAESDRQMAVR